jgi:hypothetical protein
VVDDGSTDDTQKVCERFDSRIDLKYIKLRKDPSVWVDCAYSINVGIRAAKGAVIIPTHPEIYPGADAVTAVCDLATDNAWVSCKGYYLRPVDMDNLDTVNWREEGPKAFRQLPGFYDPQPGGHPDYHPAAIETVGKPGGTHPSWLSWIFAGTTRRLWSRLGGFIPTTAWGAVDLLMVQRRQRLGIATVTPTGDDEYVAHFNHDRPQGEFTPTDRDMKKCFDQAPYLSVEQCHWPGVDELWGPLP